MPQNCSNSASAHINTHYAALILLDTHSYEAINASTGTSEHTHTLKAVKTAVSGPAVLSAMTAVSHKGCNHSDLYSRESR